MQPVRVRIYGRDRWFFTKTPHADAPGRVPDDVFDRLDGYDDIPDAAPFYSSGQVQRRYYPSEASALAALARAEGR